MKEQSNKKGLDFEQANLSNNIIEAGSLGITAAEDRQLGQDTLASYPSETWGKLLTFRRCRRCPFEVKSISTKRRMNVLLGMNFQQLLF